MKKLRAISVTAAFAIILLFIYLTLQHSEASPPPEILGSENFDAEAIEKARVRGSYIAKAADCEACHTAPESSASYAGGYPISTPFGRIISTNITPDPETGIGKWNEDEFIAAVQRGKRRDGSNIYPAMPYPSFSKISPQDMKDLWIYMRSITPIRSVPASTDLPFPFNLRASLIVWNWLFASDEPFLTDPRMSEVWNRGAYLVSALAHCSVCHTAKNFLGGDSSYYLQGGNIGLWFAPDITNNPRTGIGAWSDLQLEEYLSSGSNHMSVASGPMAEVISKSTQYLTNPDIRAITDYLRTVPGASLPSSTAARWVPPENAQGAEIYKKNCSVCHLPNGKGAQRRAAALAGNPTISSVDPTSLINTVVYGSKSVSTVLKPSAGFMPPFGGKLSNKEIAEVLTFIRSSWGNSASEVSPATVESFKLKAQTSHNSR